MKILFFSTKDFEFPFFDAANQRHHFTISYLETKLDAQTAKLAQGYDVVCCFVNDRLDENTILRLKEYGIKLIALRSAGFNHVNLAAAAEVNIPVVRVPKYSPYAVAEHAVALILTLNRHIHRAYQRVRDANFALHGLLGFDLHGCTVGVIGLGQIGEQFAKIMQGFGCKIYAYDPYVDAHRFSKTIEFVDLTTLCQQAKIISLHCPLTDNTRHMINHETIAKMQPGVMLINTGRGALIDTQAVIDNLKTKKIGYLGLDVYEEEADLFFDDKSDQILQDDIFARLLTFPNVVITGHQAFFTEQALHNIAETTLFNIQQFKNHEQLKNQVKLC